MQTMSYIVVKGRPKRLSISFVLEKGKGPTLLIVPFVVAVNLSLQLFAKSAPHTQSIRQSVHT